MRLVNRILLGLVVGVIVGLVLNGVAQAGWVKGLDAYVLNPLGQIFLRLIKMLVAPLVLLSLIVGTAGMGNARKVGRVGAKIIAIYMITTALAVILGLVLAGVFAPGRGYQVPASFTFEPKPAPSVVDTLLNVIPTNPFEALMKGEMLQIIVFAILFGLALTALGERAKGLLQLLEVANEAVMKLIMWVMELAPYAVFALMARMVMAQGAGVLLPLGKYIVIVYVGCILHAAWLYSLIVGWLGRISPIEFFKRAAPAMVVAFTTASSNATLPVTMQVSERNFGIRREIGSFTLPLGATVNMDGTALYQGVSALFLAQILGIPLTLSQMAIIVLSATLASIGTAGVPGAGVIMLAMVLQSVGIPVEAIGIIIGVDRVVDMIRTMMNVTGDLACTTAVARSEGAMEFPATIEVTTAGARQAVAG
ncbi:MAG: dicarboxylate/amino acid:cation symporter [Limnochordaceae bacterium]|nr:dicarboxylate/amino acid:cation symporter [Limnochordaceae bacterium]